MERYEKIVSNTIFMEHIQKIDRLEKDRIYCRHNSGHLMDVARIAMLINLDEEYNISKDLIYASALLHDIGRDIEYEEGISHEIASADIAPEILTATSYTEDEIDIIVKSIINHRNPDIKMERSLTGLLYRADKLSRACYLCNAYDKCHKAIDKRNEVPVW